MVFVCILSHFSDLSYKTVSISVFREKVDNLLQNYLFEELMIHGIESNQFINLKNAASQQTSVKNAL
jgi:hypothetical protein